MMAFFSRLAGSARLALALSTLAAVFGMGLVIYATSAGPGVGGDATIYLTTARNLLAGQGLGWTEADGSYRFLPYSPPFYPLALSAAGLVVRDMTAAARWLNVLVAGASALLAGWGFFLATRRAWLAGILAGLLAASPVLIGVQVWAMSETLFLLTGFGGLALLTAYLECGHRRWWLLSALLIGLSAVTRYPGIAFIGAGALALLLLSQQPAARRWTQAIRFGLLASAPLVLWLVIDVILTGSIGSRSGQPSSAYWQRFLVFGPALEQITLFWLLPESLAGRLPGLVRLLAWLVPLAAVGGSAAWLWRASLTGGDRISQTPPARLAVVMALFIGLYLLVLALTHVLVYPPVTLASRMLSPVHAAALVFVLAMVDTGLRVLEAHRINRKDPGSGGSRAARTGNEPAMSVSIDQGDGRKEGGSRTASTGMGRLTAALVYLVLLAVLGSYAARSALIAREYQRVGIGYNAPAWRDAPLLAAVRRLPADVGLISNETTALMYLLDRPAYALQEIFAQAPQASFTVYGTGDDPAQAAFREQGAALVLFNLTLRDDFSMYGEQVDERLAALTRGLRPVYQGEDGAIYFYR